MASANPNTPRVGGDATLFDFLRLAVARNDPLAAETEPGTYHRRSPCTLPPGGRQAPLESRLRAGSFRS